MIQGILAGITWSLETIIIGIALSKTPLSDKIIILAPFISTFVHDLFSSIYISIYNVIIGNFTHVLKVFKTKEIRYIIFASMIGGPIGMSGYVICINYMGASIGAIASAIYPAIGTLLATIFLKETITKKQLICLLITLAGVFYLGYSPEITVKDPILGIMGALMCSIGWGLEAVILAKCLKNKDINDLDILNIRQVTSTITYGLIIIPILNAYKDLTLLIHYRDILFIISLAALFATLSYLFYYKAIDSIGASKAMALNITYVAWAIVFGIIILKDYKLLNPTTLIATALVIVCGILTAHNKTE